MNMRIGHWYRILFSDGHLVSGMCDKIDQESVILKTLIKSWIFFNGAGRVIGLHCMRMFNSGSWHRISLEKIPDLVERQVV